MIVVLLWMPVMLFSRLAERSWFSPGALLALVLGGSAFGTAIFAPEYYQSLEANLYLQLLVLLTSIGVIVGRSIPGSERRVPPLKVTRRLTFLVVGYASSILSFAITLGVLGLRFSELLSPLAIIRAAQTATKTRYIEGLEFPLTYNLANAVLMAYTAIVIVHMVSSRKFSFAMIGPVLVFIGANLLVTTRSPLIMLGLTSAFAGVYAYMLNSQPRRLPKLFTRKSWPIILLSVGLLLAIFFSFQTLRFGETSTRTAGEVWDHLRRWPWGSLPGFSLWWDGFAPYERTDYLPGFYTFMGLYDNLGIEDRVVGGYTGYVPLTPLEPGNIYTAFRGLIHDFGTIGAGVAMFGIGVTGGVAVAGRVFSPIVSMSLYILVCGFAAYSFVVSYWAYTSNILAVILIPLFISIFMGTHSTSKDRVSWHRQ